MNYAKFLVNLKGYVLAIVTGLSSGYVVLFAPYFSSNEPLFTGMLLLGVLIGFFITAFIYGRYDKEIASERHTEEQYRSKINRLDRGHKLLVDYFMAVETGIICGAVIDTAQKIGIHSLTEAAIFAGIVAIFVVFCYVIVYTSVLALDWIHLNKRRSLTTKEAKT